MSHRCACRLTPPPNHVGPSARPHRVPSYIITLISYSVLPFLYRVQCARIPCTQALARETARRNDMPPRAGSAARVATKVEPAPFSLVSVLSPHVVPVSAGMAPLGFMAKCGARHGNIMVGHPLGQPPHLACDCTHYCNSVLTFMPWFTALHNSLPAIYEN